MKKRYHFSVKNCLWLWMAIILVVFFSLKVQAQTGPEIIWKKTYGGDNFEVLTSLFETTDGGYIMGGQSFSLKKNSIETYDYWIVKIDINGEKVWDKKFNGDGSETLNTMLPTLDEGFILLGTSTSRLVGNKNDTIPGNSNYWVLKLDAKGNKVWDKVIARNSGFSIKTIIQNSEGELILAGNIKMNYVKGDSLVNKKEWKIENTDFWVLKLTPGGNVLWNKTYGGATSVENLRDFKLSKDGGILLGGITKQFDYLNELSDSNFRVIKIDTKGNKIWDRTFGGQSDDEFQAINLTKDGGCILQGESSSIKNPERTPITDKNFKFWIIKLDSKGSKSWDKPIGHWDQDIKVTQQASDGGYILAGTSYKSETANDFWVRKIDKRGKMLWERTFGGRANDDFKKIIETKDKEFILAGLSSYYTNSDFKRKNIEVLIVKIDRKGNLLWQQTLHGGSRLISLFQGSDDAILLGGQSALDKFDDASLEKSWLGGDNYWALKLRPNAKKQKKKLKKN